MDGKFKKGSILNLKKSGNRKNGNLNPKFPVQRELENGKSKQSGERETNTTKIMHLRRGS